MVPTEHDTMCNFTEIILVSDSSCPEFPGTKQFQWCYRVNMMLVSYVSHLSQNYLTFN